MGDFEFHHGEHAQLPGNPAPREEYRPLVPPRQPHNKPNSISEPETPFLNPKPSDPQDKRCQRSSSGLEVSSRSPEAALGFPALEEEAHAQRNREPNKSHCVGSSTNESKCGVD